jgi:hypothetical protein
LLSVVVASLVAAGRAPAGEDRPDLPSLEVVLAAHDEHLKAFAKLRMSWIEVSATVDRRRVFAVELTAFERAASSLATD